MSDKTEAFVIQFWPWQVLFDIWPDDLTITIGRMAVVPWKSCYVENGVQDSILCGVIVGVHDEWIRVESGGGFTETSISNAFLVPLAMTKDVVPLAQRQSSRQPQRRRKRFGRDLSNSSHGSGGKSQQQNWRPTVEKARTWTAMASSAALATLLALATNGCAVVDQAGEPTKSAKFWLKAGKYTDAGGATKPIILEDARPAEQAE